MKRKATLALFALFFPAAAVVTLAQASAVAATRVRPSSGVQQRERDDTRGVAVRLRGYHTERNVALAGSFNNWQPARGGLARDGDFLWLLELKPGKYAYKFVVDGRWITDPYNPRAEHDGNGNVNSMLVVSEAGGGRQTNLMPAAEARRLDIRDGLADVGGHRLHFNCMGRRRPGQPVVVMEAGNMSSSQVWFKVQPEVARFARVCVYDRAGRGGSEPAATQSPRTSEEIERDFRALLGKLNVRAPYVLVGHSLGGVLVRLYAGGRPREVAGMVLVDSAHEEQEARMEALIPPEVKAQFTEEERTVQSSERLDFKEIMARATASRWTGRVPLVVLTAGRFELDADPRTAPLAPKFERLRLELQRELAGRSTRGRQVVARKSGHFIHWDEPELVVEAIRGVLGDARAVAGGRR